MARCATVAGRTRTSIHFTQVIQNNEAAARHLCEGCAAAQGLGPAAPAPTSRSPTSWRRWASDARPSRAAWAPAPPAGSPWPTSSAPAAWAARACYAHVRAVSCGAAAPAARRHPARGQGLPAAPESRGDATARRAMVALRRSLQRAMDERGLRARRRAARRDCAGVEVHGPRWRTMNRSFRRPRGGAGVAGFRGPGQRRRALHPHAARAQPQGFRFGPRADAADRAEVLRLARGAAERTGGCSGRGAGDAAAPGAARQLLLERHLVSRD